MSAELLQVNMMYTIVYTEHRIRMVYCEYRRCSRIVTLVQVNWIVHLCKRNFCAMLEDTSIGIALALRNECDTNWQWHICASNNCTFEFLCNILFAFLLYIWYQKIDIFI